MSMQALNKLVARSIIDPSVMQSFTDGSFAMVLEDFDFSAELKTRLTSIDAPTFAEFSILAYRTVKAVEEAQTPRIELPSPLEGLLDDRDQASGEQVA
ncbi:MAG: hypothetical protein WBR18_10975 [Anaerolineales bacterium]